MGRTYFLGNFNHIVSIKGQAFNQIFRNLAKENFCFHPPPLWDYLEHLAAMAALSSALSSQTFPPLVRD